MTDKTQTVTVPNAGETSREEFTGKQLQRTGETASTALAAQAKASVEAGYLMAMRNPRDVDQVRAVLLKACERPAFARNARYSKPVGSEKNENTGEWEKKFAEGLSIRFAEEALRTMGNLLCEASAIYEDNRKKIVRFTTTDMETNAKWSKDITIEKTTERRQLKRGQQALGQRINSYGDVVYLVEATPDDVAKKEGAEASKALRDQVLKLVPADIKEEALSLIKRTIADATAKDPDAEKKRVMDAFSGIGIQPARLKEYLGHDLDTISPAELDDLRGIYSAINDSETTWAAVMAEKDDVDAAKAADAQKPATGDPKPAAKGQQNLTDVAAASKAKRENKTEPGSTA